MNSGQRMIKYFAILLAASLTIGIIVTVVNVGLSVVGAFVSVGDETQDKKGNHHIEDSESKREDGDGEEGGKKTMDEYALVENLEIESSIYKIMIQEKEDIESVKVEMRNVPSSYNVTYKESTKTLSFQDEDWVSGFFNQKRKAAKGKIYIYIPEEKQLNRVRIEMGVGTVNIHDISMKSLDIECGVGMLSCSNVTAENADIEGGVGSIAFKDIAFSNFQLEGGVGDIDVEGKLTGKTVVSAGMGNINIHVDGKKDNYNYNIETGLGPIYIDGEKTGDINFSNNSCSNLLDIEGGIGTIYINFQ